MGDQSQGLGTTTVMPPARPGGPPRAGTQTGPPPSRRSVPVWVLVVAILAVAILAGATAWIVASSQPAPPPTDLSGPAITTPTVSVEPTVPVTTTTVPATATPKPKPVREPAIVTKVTWSASKGYSITVDYLQILTGQAAADAATAAGEESPPPNDYFILNEEKTLRTLSLPKSASITLLGWAGADATAKKKVSVGQFMDVMNGGANPQEEWSTGRYYVTVKDRTTVTKIEQIFFP